MKRIIKKRTVVIFIIGLFNLSCTLLNLGGAEVPTEVLPPIANPNEAATAPETSLPGESCDATPHLQVTREITVQETNQFGTRACEYRLKISNTHADKSVRFSIYQHDKDGYANTEKSHWMGNVLVEPGQAKEWTGSIYIYTDKDANGPVMSIPEKLAAVFDVPECAEAKQDESFFEQVFIALDPVCPME